VSNREVIRACNTSNKTLLKACIEAKDVVSTLCQQWSTHNKESALYCAIKRNDHKLIEMLLKPKLKVAKNSTYMAEYNTVYGGRIIKPTTLLNVIDPGSVSHMAYGTRIRKVQMGRGNRQGTNAFCLDPQEGTTFPI
jgi:hypothetical protein